MSDAAAATPVEDPPDMSGTEDLRQQLGRRPLRHRWKEIQRGPYVWSAYLAIAAALLAIAAIPLTLLRKEAIGGLDAAGVVLLSGVVAVGIERTIEFVWMAIGLMKNSFWPLTAVHEYVEGATDRLDEAVKPYADQAKSGVALLKKIGGTAEGTLTEWTKQIDTAADALDELKKKATGPNQVQVYAAAASDFANTVRVRYGALLGAALRTNAIAAAEGLAEEVGRRHELDRNPQADEKVLKAAAQQELSALRANMDTPAPDPYASLLAAPRTADMESATNDPRSDEADAAVDEQEDDRAAQRRREEVALAYIERHEPAAAMAAATVPAATVLSGIGDVIASVSDNPGKRLLSLQLGALIGLFVAVLIPLDLFTAVLHPSERASVLGVVVTGIVMGLGSSPTHELIKSLQQYKDRNKKLAVPQGGLESVGAASARQDGSRLLIAPNEAFARVPFDTRNVDPVGLLRFR